MLRQERLHASAEVELNGIDYSHRMQRQGRSFRCGTCTKSNESDCRDLLENGDDGLFGLAVIPSAAARRWRAPW